MSGAPAENQGIQALHRLIGANDYAGAEALSRSLLASRPDDVELLNLHSYALIQQGRAEEGLGPARHAAALKPTPSQLVSLARAQLHARDPAGALSTLDGVVEKWPAFAPAWASAAEICMSEAQYLAAAGRAKAGLAHCPGDLGLGMMAVFALESASHVGEALEVCRAMLPRHPTHPGLVGTIAYLHNYLTGVTPAEVFEAHRRYGKLLTRHRPVAPSAARAERAPRRLRIGFISPDFREHSVAYFISPVFKHCDRERFEVFGYFTRRVGDRITEQLKSRVDHWRVLTRMHPDEVANAIRADRLDLLIDLAGHTAGDSLEALHLRPAARRATYLGYPNTTGLPGIGYRIVDGHTDPAGSEVFCTERLIRLDPCFLCFEAPGDAPACGAPVRADEPIMFCSFNALRKINDPLIAMWSRVLSSVPGSGLLLKCNGLGEPAMRDELRARFGAHGISPDRIELLAPIKEVSGHLATYQRAHIGLDTFPYHGTTTTCEAMWMGVPVVTLAGPAHASRVGVSLLHAAGVPELIARSEEEFVSIAAGLASDRARLNQLRTGLRARLGASTLCDAGAFCRRFERAVEVMVGEHDEGTRGS